VTSAVLCMLQLTMAEPVTPSAILEALVTKSTKCQTMACMTKFQAMSVVVEFLLTCAIILLVIALTSMVLLEQVILPLHKSVTMIILIELSFVNTIPPFKELLFPSKELTAQTTLDVSFQKLELHLLNIPCQ